MLTTKLIFVDGCLPGSGKSTTSQYVTIQLHRNGRAARWFYDSEAPNTRSIERAMQEQQMLPVPRDEFVQHTLRSWQTFVDAARQTQEIAVLDSCMLQRPLVLLLSSCAGLVTGGQVDEQWLVEYYAKVQDVIKELSPVMIYLCQDNTAAFMHKVCAERGDEWSQWYINILTQSPYSQQRNLSGIKGAIEVLENFRQTGVNLFAQLAMPKIALDVAAGDWPAYYEQIMAFLDLPLKDERDLDRCFEQFVGAYKEKDAEPGCRIQLEAGRLTVQNLWEYLPGPMPLLPRTEDSFFVQSAPVEVLFEPVEKGWRLRTVEHYGARKEKTLLKHT